MSVRLPGRAATGCSAEHGDRLRWEQFFLFRPRCRPGTFPNGQGFLEVRNLAGLQLQLQLVSNQRNKFGIGRLAVAFSIPICYADKNELDFCGKATEDIRCTYRIKLISRTSIYIANRVIRSSGGWGFCFCLEVSHFRRF